MTPKSRRINWLDMIVAKPDETSSFYERVFGFGREALQEDEDHTSYFLKDGDENVLGICDAGVFPDWVSGWLPYIDVEDFDHSVAQVESCGGRIHTRMKMSYNWEGQRFCLAIDPSGAPVMICESKPIEVQAADVQPPTMTAQRVIPQLRMTDWNRSRSFYITGLGFKVDWEHRFAPESPVFARISRDGLALFLTGHAGDCQAGGAAYLEVDDVDALHREMINRGISTQHPPADQPWGRREMLLIDPDGNRLRFANPDESA